MDIERNYSKNLQLSLTGSAKLNVEGHAGIAESARVLNDYLPTTQYTIADTVVRTTAPGRAWVTEVWGYHDPATKTEVTDGIDTFLIRDGQIQTKMINYTVGKGSTYQNFMKEMGQ